MNHVTLCVALLVLSPVRATDCELGAGGFPKTVARNDSLAFERDAAGPDALQVETRNDPVGGGADGDVRVVTDRPHPRPSPPDGVPFARVS